MDGKHYALISYNEQREPVSPALKLNIILYMNAMKFQKLTISGWAGLHL